MNKVGALKMMMNLPQFNKKRLVTVRTLQFTLQTPHINHYNLCWLIKVILLQH